MKTRSLLAIWLLALPIVSQAHFLWISVDPAAKKAFVAFQEVPEREALPLGARTAMVRAWLRSGRKLRLYADGTRLRANVNAPCVAASLDYGVIDRRETGRGVFWLKYYAKGAADLAASRARLNLPVELTATESAVGPVVTLWRDDKPVADADIVIEDAAGNPTFEGKTGADGTATLPKSRGPLEVRALVTDSTPGTLDGKRYGLVRSYCTLTVGQASAKPLTQLLRESFGDMHDVVSHTAFIETARAGRLTKAQLEDHLEQRALVHQAVDDVLGGAALAPELYGDSQKEVLTLLRSNLESLGASWPAGSSAWPLTTKFLAELDQSAKTGPYFALGVFHVYYGGITHGGRDIGATIDQALKTDLTYYEKTGGYEEYAKAVNQITDPAAQKEMIRGADEAYRYIIAINNLPVFKASKPTR